jgi:hypothetical protein
MCSGAMLMSRVKRVCYAVPDPKMGCLGGATNLNDLPRVNHHLELTAGGVLETECRELLQAFFQAKRAEPDEIEACRLGGADNIPKRWSALTPTRLLGAVVRKAS